MGNISAQQVIPPVLHIPEMEVKMQAKNRGHDMLPLEPLRQDEVESDHRELTQMPKGQPIDLALNKIDELLTTRELRLLSSGFHRTTTHDGFHATLLPSDGLRTVSHLYAASVPPSEHLVSIDLDSL